MTIAYPVIAYDNLFYEVRASIAGTAALCCDWRLGTKWTGTSAATFDTPEFSGGRTCDFFALAGHGLATGGYTATLKGSDNGSTWTTIKAITPTTDRAVLELFAAVEFDYYQIAISGGSGAWSLGVVAAGDRLTMPAWCEEGVDPNRWPYRAELLRTRYGTPIGSGALPKPIDIPVSFDFVSDAFVRGAWDLFKRHAGYPGGLPFFWSWEPGDHSSDVRFCQIPDGFTFSEPRTIGLRSKGLRVSFQGVQEE